MCGATIYTGIPDSQGQRLLGSPTHNNGKMLKYVSITTENIETGWVVDQRLHGTQKYMELREEPKLAVPYKISIFTHPVPATNSFSAHPAS